MEQQDCSNCAINIGNELKKIIGNYSIHSRYAFAL